MGERRLLPYIHRQTPTTPSVYYDDDLAYWYAKRRRYVDNYYQHHPDYYQHRLYPHHPHHHTPRRYYDDYLTRRSLPVVHHDRYVTPHPRASLTYDYPRDVCHCRTLPRISSKLVPSMHYDEIRCPHCEVQVRRDEEKVMTYPWTPNPDDETLVLKRVDQGHVPHSTVSAPAQLTGNKPKVKAIEAPNTAPPFLFLKGKEKRNLLNKPRHSMQMQVVPEDQELINQISPDDSISNVGIRPFRSHHPNHERPLYSAYTEEYFHTSPRRVDDSPKPVRLEHPRRHFDGHYVDIRNGKKYRYKVNYMGDGRVDSDRQRLRSY